MWFVFITEQIAYSNQKRLSPRSIVSRSITSCLPLAAAVAVHSLCLGAVRSSTNVLVSLRQHRLSNICENVKKSSLLIVVVVGVVVVAVLARVCLFVLLQLPARRLGRCCPLIRSTLTICSVRNWDIKSWLLSDCVAWVCETIVPLPPRSKVDSRFLLLLLVIWMIWSIWVLYGC